MTKVVSYIFEEVATPKLPRYCGVSEKRQNGSNIDILVLNSVSEN